MYPRSTPEFERNAAHRTITADEHRMEKLMHVVQRTEPGASVEGSRLRVVIADPDPLARRAIRDELQQLPRFVVAAEATDGVEALELCRHYRPELLITEAVLPRIDGVELTRRLATDAPGVQVLLFAVSADPELEMRALRAGAQGFLRKAVGIAAVGPSLSAIARGEAAVSRALTMRLIERLRQVPEAGRGVRPVRSNLTTREWEVLDMLVTGESVSAIAQTLYLSQDTVYSHTKSIMRKLGVGNRHDAVEAAERLVGLSLSA
jgi:NarL family two-component system response regulator LiaR